ncbi:hypothetical protein SacazDRAFT_03710 [Saccharomonospora azurea NA-128]|uniref:Uncharacterized protein n=2 Tax=Saccharomonospora azurea TaxID=40988 RepID=H8G9R9_9PSEU|nr:hypothetical protein [Saccharomonospora azurea]EHK88588.1 hypothetical protein SZMC14600_04623 [Saccharomonospora azurea SZMC 14600]EHY90572.1 hypothetical protein SacazDRAFT_03710 [Saccharomonospora azurea NA-128]
MAGMRLFRRRPRTRHGDGEGAGSAPDPRTPFPESPVPSKPEEAAAEFWRHWHAVLPDLSAALGEGHPRAAETLLCDAVARVHPDLQLSLERGQRALYALVVSGREDPALRPYTDAWKAAAPPDDAIWEFHDSVPPVPDPAGVTVNLGAHRIALADVRVVAQVDDADGVVDVAVHHPAFADLGEPERAAMTFLPLEATLGERVAAQRLRRVETAVAPPEGTISLGELRALVLGLPGNVGGAD